MLDRLVKLCKGFFGLFVSRMETANPRALLEAETNALNEAVAGYNQNLAKQAGLVEKLKSQIQRQKKELELETARTQALFKAQQMDEAGTHALRVKQIKDEVAANEDQLKQADELYVTLSKKRDVYVRDAKTRIDAIKQKMTQTEVAESQAKLAEMAGDTAFDLGGSGATLQRLEEKLDERLNTATGKARVAADQARSGGWSLKAEEDKALQSQALAEFAASMGLEAPSGLQPAAPAAAQTRVLGPQDAGRELGPREGV